MCLFLALSCTEFDGCVIDECGLKYIIYFNKAYLWICSILLGALQLS